MYCMRGLSRKKYSMSILTLLYFPKWLRTRGVLGDSGGPRQTLAPPNICFISLTQLYKKQHRGSIRVRVSDVLLQRFGRGFQRIYGGSLLFLPCTNIVCHLLGFLIQLEFPGNCGAPGKNFVSSCLYKDMIRKLTVVIGSLLWLCVLPIKKKKKLWLILILCQVQSF